MTDKEKITEMTRLIASNIRTLDNMIMSGKYGVELNGILYTLLHANTIILNKVREG